MKVTTGKIPWNKLKIVILKLGNLKTLREGFLLAFARHHHGVPKFILSGLLKLSPRKKRTSSSSKLVYPYWLNYSKAFGLSLALLRLSVKASDWAARRGRGGVL